MSHMILWFYGSCSIWHRLPNLVDRLSPATTATTNHVKKISSANTLLRPISHCQPALWACSQITRQEEGLFYCTWPTGCKKNELAAGNRSNLHWQKDHKQPALERWKLPRRALSWRRSNIFNSCTATNAEFKATGVFGACLVYKYNTCYSRLSQLSRAAYSHGSPAGLYVPKLLCSSL